MQNVMGDSDAGQKEYKAVELAILKQRVKLDTGLAHRNPIREAPALFERSATLSPFSQ